MAKLLRTKLPLFVRADGGVGDDNGRQVQAVPFRTR